MSKKETTTVEELARLSQEQFLGINKRMDGLEGKVDAGFEKLKSQMDVGFKSIAELIRMEREQRDEKHTALENHVASLEHKVFME